VNRPERPSLHGAVLPKSPHLDWLAALRGPAGAAVSRGLRQRGGRGVDSSRFASINVWNPGHTNAKVAERNLFRFATFIVHFAILPDMRRAGTDSYKAYPYNAELAERPPS
jgi:hypothetical protein